jgi:hypothetical protein
MLRPSNANTFAPTESYELDLPPEAQMDCEGRATSIWRAGSDLALQLSSTIRVEGVQVSAKQRLCERIEQEAGSWSKVDLQLLSASEAEVAAAQLTDQHGYDWLHVYVTWPDLSVYATISGPRGQGPFSTTWALSALQSVRKKS